MQLETTRRNDKVVRNAVLLLLTLLILACRTATSPSLQEANGAEEMNELARSYVKLVLALGEHESEAVDAYYGPPELRDEVKREGRTLEQIRRDGAALQRRVSEVDVTAGDPLLSMRKRYLQRQIGAVIARAEMNAGAGFTFEKEAQKLFGVTPPRIDPAQFERMVADLEKELPGSGTLVARLDAYRARFNMKPEKVDAVMRAGMEECRARTARRVALPPEESFTLEYVKDKPWGGYNWYKGNFHSLIQVNTDLPVAIHRAIDLACHEGYPGHHAYNVLLEKNLVRDRGWLEGTVYPLYSPQSLIAEGSANYGVEMAFPGEERMKFDRDVLFPLAGLDPSEAPRYHRIMKLTESLRYVNNEAARRLIDGEMTREQAIEWLMKYGLSSRARAEQQLEFIEHYRSYVINYNYGRDLVKTYVEKFPPERRWEVFLRILSTPTLPQDLIE